MHPQVFSIENYDCIGFDLDFTLATYKLKPFFNTIYKLFATFLIEKYGYPEELAEIRESDYSFCQKGLVLDKKRGNLLKLDCRYKIIKATHGTRFLTHEDICRIYGQRGIWEESFAIPKQSVLTNGYDSPYYVFHEFYTTPGICIIAKMVDILDESHGQSLKEYDFWDHYMDGFHYMFFQGDFKNSYGKFILELKKHPEEYYQTPSKEIKTWLSNISKDKVTFFITNGKHDLAQMSAEYTLGSDWRKYFDVIITDGRKPGFFWKNEPFHTTISESEIVEPKDMEAGATYSGGNFKDFLKVCAKLSRSEKPRIAFFGDSIVSDVYAASELANCDAIAIVEEMMAEGMDGVDMYHAEEFDALTSEAWGSFFCCNSNNEDQSGRYTLWTHLLRHHSKLAIPNLDCLATLQPKDKIPCFSSMNAPLAGFYPGIPKSLISTSGAKENIE